MKRIAIITLGIILIMLASCVVLRPSFTNGMFSYCTRINGYWNEWKGNGDYYLSSNRIKFYDGNFILYNKYNHPSEYYMKVSYDLSSESREDKWYVYMGTVEYYVGKTTDNFPFREWQYNGNIIRPHSKEYRHEKISPATIKIQNRSAKDAHNGTTFNVFFEGNAIAISGI